MQSFLKKKTTNRHEVKPVDIVEGGKVDAKTFGVVVYGEPSVYPSQNVKEFHIPVSKEEMANSLIDYFQKELAVGVESVVVGHEHGDDLGKCHFQCAIKLSKRLNRNVAPFSKTVTEFKILCILQKARNAAALFNYCKKEGDFFEKAPDEPFKTVWAKLATVKDLSKCEVTNMLAKEEPKQLMLWGEKIQANYSSLVRKEELPEFKWTFPQHLSDVLEGKPTTLSDQAVGKIKAMFNWFKGSCEPETINRRQALFVVSLDRGVGKSEFAKRLVPHPSYAIYCRNTLNAAEFKAKEDTARLIILDDITYVGNEKEMWKALVSGERVNINTKYHNFDWKGGVPCIVLTNELSTANFWITSSAFNTQCVFVNIDFYLGPDGTRPLFLSRVDSHFDDDFNQALERFRAAKTFKNILT